MNILAAIHRLAETGAGRVKKVEGIHPPEFRLRVGDFASFSAKNPPARSMCAPSKTAKTPTADRPCVPSTPGGFLSA
jgi:hypothetical protein